MPLRNIPLYKAVEMRIPMTLEKVVYNWHLTVKNIDLIWLQRLEN